MPLDPDVADAHAMVPFEGQLCMEGSQLVRHYLQQARLHSEFLPGGKNHDTVVSEHVLSPEDAAEAVRDDLDAALAAVRELP